MTEKLSMCKGAKDLLDEFTKGFYFSMVHVRVNKCISNATIVEHYEKAIGIYISFFIYLHVYKNEVSHFIVYVLKYHISCRTKCFIKQIKIKILWVTGKWVWALFHSFYLVIL